MPRRSISGLSKAALPAALAALAALAGCQSYNFNPVGQCIIQPGSSRFQLSGTTVADILFVVDDSGSMQAEQARLAQNFGSFIQVLADEQKARAQNGQEPFEFHVAITTSSVFEAWQPAAAATCSGSGPSCHVAHSHYSQAAADVACSAAESGQACDDLIRDYFFPADPAAAQQFCGNAGVGKAGAAFPAGDFVAAAGNLPVLHFGKELGWASWGTASQDPALTKLVTQFQQNINVGTCGSGMEQHLEGGRLAVKKALRQDGLAQPAGVDPKEWPHAGSKLVVVWVGDEDDCSNPNDPTKSLAFTFDKSNPGSDICLEDQRKPSGQALFPVEDYAAFFTGLGRSFSAAFVYSAETGAGACTTDAGGNTVCKPGTCACQCPASCTGGCGTAAPFAGDCLIPADCSGKIPFVTRTDGAAVGSRFSQLSAALRAKGSSTFEASVCDASWSSTLGHIADLVKPPPGLTLPTQPATSDVTVLRIESADGKIARYCSGPGTAADWNFIDCKTGAPSGAQGKTASLCLVINHATGKCEASTGETYIAQYLGRVPAGGCKAVSDCTTALGGKDADWQCLIAGTDTTGTCLCSQ